MNSTQALKNLIFLVLISLFLFSCKAIKNLPGADARKYSYDEKERVKKNLEDRSISLISPSNFNRRQDAPDIFCITPVAYIAKQEEIIKRKSLWDGKIVGVEVPPEIATDIDDINDFTNRNSDCFNNKL